MGPRPVWVSFGPGKRAFCADERVYRSGFRAIERDAFSMATITKKHLVDRVSDSTSCRRVDVKKVVQAFLDEMIADLGKGNRLEFRDFGVFEIKERAPRIAQNPKTLERVEVPAKRTVKFKVGRLLKEQLDVKGAGSAAGPKVVVSPDLGNGRVQARKPASK